MQRIKIFLEDAIEFNLRFGDKMKVSVKEIVLFGVLGGFIAASQIVLSFLPNIEIVSLLIILFSLTYRKKALYIVYTFVIIMGMTYGFGLWWFGYIILWPLLSVMTFSFNKYIEERYLRLSIYSGIFGLIFGSLYAILYTLFGGLNAGVAYWISGIQYDIVHGLGNYFIMIILGEKVVNLLNNLNKRYLYV